MPSIKSMPPRLATATMLLSALCAGCAPTVIRGNVPDCERLIPAQMKERTPASDMPQSSKLPDGHDDARPWQAGFVGQTGQLEKANDRASNIDHIYAECLQLHREQLQEDTGGFFSRLF